VDIQASEPQADGIAQDYSGLTGFYAGCPDFESMILK